MHAVDTNILVRFLTRDDEIQSFQAKWILEREEVWISKTVLLEADWVLRSVYRFQNPDIRAAFTTLTGLPNITVEDQADVMNALSLGEVGIDFADTLHLVSRPAGAMFRSFDQTLVRRAQRAGI